MSENSRQEREFYRTQANLQFFWGPDTLAGRQAMTMDSQIWDGQSQLESAARLILDDESADSQADHLLLTVIRWLDFKLDVILHHLRARDQATNFPGQGTTSDLSGSGFGVAGQIEAEPGQHILVCLALPDMPSRPIFALGEVARSSGEEAGGQASTGVRFLEIAEADRERVVRFTFTQQRRLLAQRNQGGQE